MVYTRTQSRYIPRTDGCGPRCRSRDVSPSDGKIIHCNHLSMLTLTNSGLHGYSHENPTALSVEQQRDILEHTYKQLTEFCGKPPKGSVAPWWEVSKETAEMLLDKGISYGTNTCS
jgi:hypothetical protein